MTEAMKVNRKDMARLIDLNKAFEEDEEEFNLFAEYINDDLKYK